MSYLESVIKQFTYYKQLGEKAMNQLDEEQLFIVPTPESNSIAIIIQHLSGNMLSRWTDFLNTDGEKDWRQRDKEFEVVIENKEQLMNAWDQGWKVLLDTLGNLTDSDLGKIIYIRNEGHTAMEAINRQLAHYPYHIGQMVYIAKMICDKGWNSLSIPKSQSQSYNDKKFGEQISVRHFTDEFLKKKK